MHNIVQPPRKQDCTEHVDGAVKESTTLSEECNASALASHWAFGVRSRRWTPRLCKGLGDNNNTNNASGTRSNLCTPGWAG
jgi:hypothetical protein